MSFKARISRLAVAVGVAGLISTQIPGPVGVAMADDGYNLGGGNSARVPIEIAVIGLVGYGIVSTFSSGGAAAAGTAADAGAGGGGVPLAGVANTNNQLPSVYEVAKGNPDLSTFAQNADNADLKGPLSDSSSQYTVFSPSNSAFAALSPATMASLNDKSNKAQLTQLMQTHIVPGRKLSITDLKALPGADADPGASLMTMNNGAPIYVRYMKDQDALAVSTSPFGAGNTGVAVTQTDINAKNGLIHPISGVLPAPTPAAPATTPAAP